KNCKLSPKACVPKSPPSPDPPCPIPFPERSRVCRFVRCCKPWIRAVANSNPPIPILHSDKSRYVRLEGKALASACVSPSSQPQKLLTERRLKELRCLKNGNVSVRTLLLYKSVYGRSKVCKLGKRARPSIRSMTWESFSSHPSWFTNDTDI